MDIPLAWLIAGFALIIVELVTGTFYLLVLGLAALVGAGIGYAGGAMVWQAIVAAAVAVAGFFVVHRYKQAMSPQRMPGLDVGQPAVFEAWVDQGAGQARVRYRDALWDARVEGDAPERGEILYISAADGNTLKVSKIRPA